MPAPSKFDLPRLATALRPLKLHHFEQLPSTNDKAIELRRSGELFAPAIVLATSQTAGRGRGANRWLSGEGSLTVTYVLPVEEHLQPHQLPLVAGIAVRNAVTELTGDVDVSLKWPNDVLHSGRKLAGLLCERISGVDMMGIGINVNQCPSPTEIKTPALSLATMVGRDLDLSAVLITLTAHLKRCLLARHSQPFAAFLEEYRQHDALLGQDIVVDSGAQSGPLHGTCEGIDEEGRLLLRCERRLHRIITGSIALYRAAI